MLHHEDKEIFRNWLIDNKRINKKVAGDILSRANRASKIINLDDVNSTAHLISDLISNIKFQSLTVSVRSQIKRSVILYREFKNIA